MGHDWFQNLSEDLAGTQGLGGFDKTPTIQLDELMKETVMSRKGRYVPCIVEHVDSLFLLSPKGFLFFPHYFFNCWLNSYHLYMLFECCFECVLQNLLFGAGAFWYSPLCQKRFLDHAFGALLCHKWCFLVLFFLHCSLLSKHCALDCVFGALLPVQN
jgi:hypothetical protein